MSVQAFVFAILTISFFDGCLTNDNAVGGCLCPTIAFPVCGTDDKTYLNLCTLECKLKKGYNVRFASPGPCIFEANEIKTKYEAQGIWCDCPKIYKPVCASNGGTYASKCVLNCEKKMNPKNAGLTVDMNAPCIKPYFVQWIQTSSKKRQKRGVSADLEQ